MLSWPTAPFVDAEFQGTIYTNQAGRAVLKGQQFTAPRQVHGYELFFDDGGQISIQTRSRLFTKIAFFDQPGAPARVSIGRAVRNGIWNIPIEPDRRTLYISVQSRNPNAVGAYDLTILGIRHGLIRAVNPARKGSAFHVRNKVSEIHDADFFSFTTSAAGRWELRVVPDASLDASFQVFDRRGWVVGGTFDQPIDTGGLGATESWSADLPAGTPLFIRIDGRDSTGWFRIHARLQAPPSARAQ